MARVTIRDLAKASGFSVCTINKALNGKPWVSDDTRQKIVQLAAEMGYTPNRLAQSLARRHLTIGMVYPNFWGQWFAPLVAGAREQLNTLHDHNISAKFYAVEGSPTSHNLDDVLAQVSSDTLDGVLLCMGALDEVYAQQGNRLNELNIPIVLLGGAHPGIPHLTHVRTDARRSGRMAGELLGLITHDTPVAMLVGKHAILDHKEKADGFSETMEAMGRSVLGVYETLSDAEIAYHVTRRLFADAPQVGGIYIAVDNAAPGVCRYIQEAGLAQQVSIVATGVFAEICTGMAQGVIQATLHQNMVEQGRVAVSTLYHYLVDHAHPSDEILIAPDIAIRSNIDLLAARVPSLLL